MPLPFAALCRTLALTCVLGTPAVAEISIEIDLTKQRAFLLQDGVVTYTSPISSGRSTHPTPTGDFAVLEKDADHRSSLYGKVVDAGGNVVNSGADYNTPVPRGGAFVQAPMKHFLRFDGAAGMHAGHLPGYPASHGCVRMPSSRAKLFFELAEVGSPVRVYGTPPYRASSPERPARAKGPEEPSATPAILPEPAKSFFTRIFQRKGADRRTASARP